MKRYLLAFAIITIAVLVGGYAVFSRLIETTDHSDRASSPVSIAEPAPVPSPPQETPDASPAEPKKLTVIATNGVVKRRDPKDGSWVIARPGDVLATEDIIKTLKGADAKLAVDDTSKISLSGRTELSVKEITDTVHQVNLVLGRIDVDYAGQAGERLIRISSPNSDAVAESKEGKFVVQNANGVVSVATTSGAVDLLAQNKSVTVEQGKIARVVPGQPPTAPTPIPLSVMLRVANPDKLIQEETFTTIRGRTDIGARVSVNDVPAAVDPNGSFWVKIPLRAGKNDLEVVAETGWGSATRRVPQIEVNPKGKVDSATVRWGKRDGRPPPKTR